MLFHKPFLSFSRPSEEGNGDMNSRFDTLLNMFDLKNRYIISPENCVEIDTSIDYSRVDKILQQKRSEADIFLKSALSIKWFINEDENIFLILFIIGKNKERIASRTGAKRYEC